MLTVVLLVGLLCAGAGVAGTYTFVERGPRGAEGPAGPEGPEGEAGGLDEGEVRSIAHEEGTSAAQDAIDNQDPSPEDLGSQIDDLDTRVQQTADDLSAVCSDLEGADALSDIFLSCP